MFNKRWRETFSKLQQVFDGDDVETTSVTDEEVAIGLCERLNTALTIPQISQVLPKLLGTTVEVSSSLEFSNFNLRFQDNKSLLSVLGLLNGTLKTHKLVAVYDNERKFITHFKVKAA